MPNIARSFALRYGLAAVSIVLATWVRLLLDPALGFQFPFATFFFAILFTAWYGGFGPALAAVVLGALSSNYFIMPPRGRFAPNDFDQQVGMGLYVLTSLGIALIGGAMQVARQQAEASAEAVRRQAALIDQTYDAVLVWERNGPITFWNRGAERLYGFSRAEALGLVSHTLLQTKRPGGVDTFVNSLERAGSWEGELEHQTLDGQKIIVESRMVLVREAERSFVLEANRDITARRRAEESLRETNDQLESRVRERTAALVQASEALQVTEERFRLFIEGVQEYAIFMLDLSGKVVTWNRGAERNKGYRSEDIIGRHFSCFYPNEEIARGKPEQQLQRALAEGRCEDEGWRVRKDGSRFWAQVTITALLDNVGKPHGFAKVTRDITEGKRAQERFSQAVESAPNGMVMINSEGKIVLVNAQTEKLFGYRRDELLGQPVELLVSERLRAQHADYRTNFFAKPQVRSMGVGRDLYGRRTDGSVFPVEIGLNPIKTDEGLMVLSAIVDITERKRAEESRRENEERFHVVIDNMTEGVVISDLDGQLLHWNRAALELHGFASSEEWCRRLPEFVEFFELATIDGQVVKVEEWPMSRLLRGERLSNYELRVRRLDTQRERIFSYGGDVVLDAAGRKVAFLTMFDITERKRAEDALRERERLLGIVTGSARVGLVVVSVGYRYLFANEAYAELFGLDARAIVGRRVSDVLAVGWPQIQPRLDRALAGEQLTYELTLPPVLGGQAARFFTVFYEPRTGDDGEPTVVVVVVDISERKRAEEALHERERTLRLFITYAPAAIAMFDCNMAYVSASHRWASDYGLEMQDIIGRSHYDLFPDIPGRWKDIHRRCLAGASEKCEEDQFPRLDGTVDWVRWEVLPWYKSNGAIGGIIIFSEDITQHKQAEEALCRINADLEQGVLRLGEANRELRARRQENEAFVYSVSHDLRSPLVNLQGFSKELSRSAQDLRTLLTEGDLPTHVRDRGLSTLDGAVAKSVRFIQTAVTRLSNIIDALLRLSRAGRVVYQQQRVDVQAIVARVVDSLRGTADERGATIQVNELPPALGDPAAVEQIFANLIGNALNYLDSKRPGRIEAGSLGPEQGSTGTGLRTYYVRDNGLGITEATREKVFQPFQRLHPQAAPGEGMGLAIVQRVVERHGGRIWFDSTTGQGSTFFVTLPACPDGESQAPPGLLRLLWKKEPTSMTPGPLIILLAEDDEGHAELIRLNLERARVLNGIVHVPDGQEALDFVRREGKYSGRRHGPLIMLLDINMPRLDGIETLRQLKADPRTARIPVIMLTTTDDPREVERCYELGCNIYITKPVEYEPFCNALRELGVFLQFVMVPHEAD